MVVAGRSHDERGATHGIGIRGPCNVLDGREHSERCYVRLASLSKERNDGSAAS